MSRESPWDNLDGQALLGSKEFVEQFTDLLQEKESIKEIPRHQRFATRPCIGEIFAEAGSQTKSIRNEKIYDAHVEYGYTLKDVSDFLGIHYTTVSKVIQKMGQK